MNHIESVRKRPGMYIGSTTPRGLTFLLYELLDNAVDQFLKGRATTIQVRAEGEYLEVTDDGEGLPFDIPHPTDGNLMTHYLTQAHDTATADGHVPHIHGGGMHGVGIAVVNALSVEFTATTWRNGGRWQQSFTRGISNGDPVFTAGETGKGTHIRLRIDPDIFRGAVFSRSDVRQNVFTTAHLFAGLRIRCNDEIFFAPDGLADLCAIFYGTRWQFNTEKQFHIKQTVNSVAVEVVAFDWGWHRKKGASTSITCFANGSNTIEGGSHIVGMQRAFRAVGWMPTLAMIHVVMYDAQYAGPTRTKLDSPIAGKAVYKAMKPTLVEYCKQYKLGQYANPTG